MNQTKQKSVIPLLYIDMYVVQTALLRKVKTIWAKCTYIAYYAKLCPYLQKHYIQSIVVSDDKVHFTNAISKVFL